MTMKYTMLSLASLLALVFIMPAYAETYNVEINKGSFDKSCVPDCLSPQVINILPGDTVVWTNHETDSTKNHGFVSGNPTDGLDGGPLDSGTIRPGESFSYTFNSQGQFDYFDMSKKWIQGSVIVGVLLTEERIITTTETEIDTENGTEIIIEETVEIQVVEIEPDFEQRSDTTIIRDELLESLYQNRVNDIKELINVGLDINADNVHTVRYIFNDDIANSRINLVESGNTLDFSFREPVTGNLVLKMPNSLIGETLTVTQEINNILPHTYSQHGEYSIVEIDINQPSRTLTLGAVYIVPEYLSMFIFGISIMIIIGVGVYLRQTTNRPLSIFVSSRYITDENVKT